ncbi:LPXTG cell wall anchor domain-containing protein [Levilactobacillus sp. HBUAS70063]|uniref:LPXTG cell wall anchor domain-containing protein n=1 Tax=Levilactobacillus sp. HBUAS70063 TaxID=3109359 RepID=UPI0031333E55
MKMKWQHGVMLSLFASGFLMGSGGMVGLAADGGKTYALHVNYMICARDEGRAEVDRLYKSEIFQVRPGDQIPGKPELAAYLTSMRTGTGMQAPEETDRPMVWTYTGARKLATVKLSYVNTQTRVVVASRIVKGTVTVGGKLNIVAPVGYRLEKPTDVDRLVHKVSEAWQVAVTPKSTQSGTDQATAPGTPQTDAGEKPNAGEHSTPPVTAKPSQPVPPTQGTGDQPSQPEKPVVPDQPGPVQPGGTPTRPGNPLPIAPILPGQHPLPTEPVPAFPLTHPELVVPVAPDPTDESDETGSQSVGPSSTLNPTSNLDHVSELAEQPVTAIDEPTLSSTPASETKPAKASQTAQTTDSQPLRAGGRQWRIQKTKQQSKLPQTNEQTAKASLLGLVALAGIGGYRFWRFRD